MTMQRITIRQLAVAFFIGMVMLLLFTRLWNLTGVPPSPYWEEAALGYDAYSLMKTGKDHHGNPWPLVALESFGDWKPALYAYSIIPFLFIFDLSLLAVRLPSAISGIILVLLTVLLGHKFKIRWYWLLLVGATSPWLIMFSRAGWEVMLATALLSAGVTGLIYQRQMQSQWLKYLVLTLSSVAFGLSTYTYHSARVVAPLLLLLILVLTGVKLASQYPKKRLLSKGISEIGFPLVIFLMVILPFLFVLNSPILSQRVKETSFVDSQEILRYSLEAQGAGGPNWLNRKLFNPYVLYGEKAVLQFASHFNPDFLFISGDTNRRHSTGFTALFYWFDAIFLIFGSYWLIRNRTNESWLLLGWLVIGILPISLTKDAPHALRLLITSPVWMIGLAAGYQATYRWLLSRWLMLAVTARIHKQYSVSIFLTIILMLIPLVQLVFFWRYYTKIYPIKDASWWQQGYKTVFQELNQLDPTASIPTYISRFEGRPMMYYWFYSKTDPTQVQSFNDIAIKDQGEYLNFQQLSTLPNAIPSSGPAIILQSAMESSPSGFIQVDTISRNDHPLWQIYERQ